MRFTLITVLLLLTGLIPGLSALDLFYDLDLGTVYDSNILKISDDDIVRFESGLEREKFRINSSDDFISEFGLKLGIRNPDFLGHTQIIRFSTNYVKYWNNDLLDRFNIGFRLKQYLSRKLNLELKYFHYPEIYVNRYDSVLDPGTNYRDFTYAKNSAYLQVNYRLFSYMKLSYQFEYSQLFYNEYFTEYDTDQLENTARCSLYPVSGLRIGLEYTYRNSAADGPDAYSSAVEIEESKDPSHEVDIYRVHLDYAGIRLFNREIRFGTGLGYRESFYTTTLETDTYHYGRKDFFKDWSCSVDIDLGSGFSAGISYLHSWRDVFSPVSKVESDKRYQRNRIGLEIGYRS